jgi:hypothetical protein
LLIVAGLFALAIATAHAQTPAPAAPTKAPTITNDGTAMAAGDKKCTAATRKLEREQNSLDRAHAEVARYDKLQQSCATKSACARYISALEALEKRVARHEHRIDKFTAARGKVCKT